MFQGTGSDVGKSLLVAGLCRAWTERGLTVRPFKPQNMSNNAAITVDGGEIGRAQALQARACRTAPVIDMNPVLLKPQTETGAQVIVQGRIHGNARAGDYQRLKPTLLRPVLESFRRVAVDADLVLVEGAGSAAEVNLRPGDIANMGFAEAADVPVVLIGDIDRGGVIASIVGTVVLLTGEERRRLKGYVINKFRGDRRLFDSGVAIINERTGLSCFGVVPWFDDARRLPAEDSVALETYQAEVRANGLRIAVPLLPRIANFDDLDPLIAEEDVVVDIVAAGRPLPADADLILLPGSKATLADLAFLRHQGWDIDIAAHVRRGGRVLGLCGGYQMLGRSIDDPDGIEGRPGRAAGLGLLDVDTTLTADKTLTETEGVDTTTGSMVRGYEMHVGRTTGRGCSRPMLRIDGCRDGAMSEDGRVQGCYLHGLFASDAYRGAFLSGLRRRERSTLAFDEQIEHILDTLARHVSEHMDLDRLLAVSTPLRREG